MWPLLGLAILGLVCCHSSSPVSPSAESRISTPSEPGLLVTSEVGDEVTVDMPPGWVKVPEEPVYKLVVTKGPKGDQWAKGPKGPTMRVFHYDAKLLRMLKNVSRDEPVRADAEEKVELEPGSTAKRIPDMKIDFEKAVGVSWYDDERKTPMESWYVARRDGLWWITLRSAPGAPAVPDDLKKIMKSIRWTRPVLPASPSSRNT